MLPVAVPLAGGDGEAGSETRVRVAHRDVPGTPSAAAAGAATPSAQPAAKPAAADSNPAPPAEAPLVGDASEREIRVDTRDVIAVFTNRGARLKSWRLKHYLDHQMQPQELVVNDLPSQPLPFTLARRRIRRPTPS